MNYKKLIIYFLSLFALLLFVRPVWAGSKENNIVVKLDRDLGIEEISNKYHINANQISQIPNLDVIRVKNPSFWQKLNLNWHQSFLNDIDYIESEKIYQPSLIPNDPYYTDQWALGKISAPSAWETTTGSTGVKIAIVDTGINGLHEDLNGKVTAGYAFLDAGQTRYGITANSDSDDFNHGTAVAGVAAVLTNNSVGMSGLDWNAELMPLKIFNASGLAYSSDIAEAIVYAANNGAKVINLSLGSIYSSSVIEEAINYAYGKNCLIIASSGNENTSVSYPAKYSNAIAVGATDQQDRRTFSNYGPELDVVAPGEDILIPIDSESHNEYAYAEGTSLTAPYVSALASLIWAKNPNLSNAEVRSYIEGNTDKVSGMNGQNFTNEYGYGRINANKVFHYLIETDPDSYHYQWISQNIYPAVNFNEGYNFSVTVKNTGAATWYRGTVNLGTDRAQDRIADFLRADINNLYGHPSHWFSDNRVFMNEEAVSPGQTATFSFWMSAVNGMSPGVYHEYFRLVADGIAWMEDYGIYWDVTIGYPQAQWVGQSSYPSLNAGDSATLWAEFRNTGQTSWNKSGYSAIRLGTSHPKDRESIFKSNWPYQNRINLDQDSVSPGQVGRFTFDISVPVGTPSGIYREYFQPVVDGLMWLEDYGVYWDVTVN